MYVAKTNIQQSPSSIKKYIEENGFATIISVQNGLPLATHTPLMLAEEGGQAMLHGHIARANSQSDDIKHGSNVMAMFMENHTYISSSWYDHVNVPTWNYIAVHVYGKFEIMTEEETLASLNALVAKYEKNASKPFHISQMSDTDRKAHIRSLTAFKIVIDRIDASWKLSQNRDDKNYFEIIRRLKERGDEMSLKIALEMETLR